MYLKTYLSNTPNTVDQIQIQIQIHGLKFDQIQIQIQIRRICICICICKYKYVFDPSPAAAIIRGNACHGPHSDSLYSGSERSQFNSPRLVKRQAGFPNPRRELIGSNQLWRSSDSPYNQEFLTKIPEPRKSLAKGIFLTKITRNQHFGAKSPVFGKFLFTREYFG